MPSNLKTTLKVNERSLAETISRADDDALLFKSVDGETLRPLYDLHRQRYVVYWEIME